MTDLNLEGLPVLNRLWKDGLPQFNDRREHLRAELRQLVERERKAAWNDGFLYALRAEEEGRRFAREEIENSD